MELKYTNEKTVLQVIALLKAYGIRKVVASPGTTNVTFIGSIMHDDFFQMYSCVDERSAAYIACGMAEESGEPVVLSCTGATASRNYFPGLTEAYYRKLPIVAITSTREEYKIGHLIDQQIDRTSQPKDTVVCSEHLPIIKDEEDLWNCTIKINRALLALKEYGGGPVHLNMPTRYNPDFSVVELPNVRKINRYHSYEELPEIGDRDVAIFIGSHKRMTAQEVAAIDRFCEVYNAVVIHDSNSGYWGKYGLTVFGAQNDLGVDLLIHIGEVSCSAYQCYPHEVWRVNEDGALRDTYRKLTNVFEMPEYIFFEKYNQNNETKASLSSKYDQCKIRENEVYARIKDVPFSNSWIASYLHDKLPKNSLVHLGIVSTYFAWSRFHLDPSISVVCNQGGFGIDGNISTLIGASIVSPEKICFCFVGDLAFFYDINSLGNRHVGNNIRIMLINNGQGALFRTPGNFASMFGDEAERYISAGGHFGNQSKELVKHYAEDLGFEYMSASTKDEFVKCSSLFTRDTLTSRPLLLEVFVPIDNEISGNDILEPLPKKKGLKTVVKNMLGDELVSEIKTVINNLKGKSQQGSMSVDVGHN